MSIVFFILGGALSVSTLIALDQYNDNLRLQKKVEKLQNDLRSNSQQ